MCSKVTHICISTFLDYFPIKVYRVLSSFPVSPWQIISFSYMIRRPMVPQVGGKQEILVTILKNNSTYLFEELWLGVRHLTGANQHQPWLKGSAESSTLTHHQVLRMQVWTTAPSTAAGNVGKCFFCLCWVFITMLRLFSSCGKRRLQRTLNQTYQGVGNDFKKLWRCAGLGANSTLWRQWKSGWGLLWEGPLLNQWPTSQFCRCPRSMLQEHR